MLTRAGREIPMRHRVIGVLVDMALSVMSPVPAQDAQLADASADTLSDETLTPLEPWSRLSTGGVIRDPIAVDRASDGSIAVQDGEVSGTSQR
jgi:hypothetical protein